MARFILEWEQDHLPERNVKRIADNEAEAMQGIRDLLAGESWFDEEAEGGEYYEDSLVDAVEAFVRENGELEAFVAGLRVGEEEEFRCEEGTLKVYRDR